MIIFLIIGGRERGTEGLIEEKQFLEFQDLLCQTNNIKNNNSHYGNDENINFNRNLKSSPELLIILAPLPLLIPEKRGRESNFLLESQLGE